MAAESTFSGYNGRHFFLRITNGGTSKDSSTMKSITTFYLYIGSYDGYSASGNARTPSISGSVSYAASVSGIAARSTTHIGTTSVTVEHDANGNPKSNAYASASIDFPWSGCNYAAVDISINPGTITPPAPSYISISATEITSSSVRLKAAIDTKGRPITGGGWDITTDPNKASWNYEAGDVTDKTLTGLQANTTYYYRGYCVTSAGGSNSSWASFKTAKPAKPSITSVTTNSIDEDNFNIVINASASLQASISTVYVSIDNGSTWLSNTADILGNNWNISGLQVYTQYNVKVKVKDNFNTESDVTSLVVQTSKHKIMRLITPTGRKMTPVTVYHDGTHKDLDTPDVKVVN